MHEPKLAKGKAREETHWQLGWWELLPLVDGPRQPVAWSKSSVIYTAHPTQPAVLARHYPSSRQFLVSPPLPTLDSNTAYDPPTVISVSPTEDWLFAYFPGRGCDGMGCIWKRNYQLDSWTVGERFHYPQDAGVVTAEWTSLERPWAVGEQGNPYRLPPRGPIYQSNAVPSLLLVTQSHQLHACFLPPAVPEIRHVKISLLQQQQVADSSPSEEPHDFARSRRVCTHASIGLSYNEQQILVATRSKLMPPPKLAFTSMDPMDLSLHLDMSTPPNAEFTEWQQWGEESSIDLCTVALHYLTLAREREEAISRHVLRTSPLPPISEVRARLTDLRFVTVPPSTVPASPTITRDPRRPTKETGATDKGTLYLVASSMDLGEYSSLPKSQILLFSLSRTTAPDGSWVPRLEKTRAFDSDAGTLAFVQPFHARNKLLAGFLDPVGNMPASTRKRKETRVGTINVLSLPDLKTNDQWETVPIISVMDGTGRDIPVGVAVSPNHAFICTVSPSSVDGSRTSIHPYPRQAPVSTPFLGQRNELSRMLLSAIYSRRSPSDVIHALASVPYETAATILYEALAILETHSNGMDLTWKDEFLGIVTEMYRIKSHKEENEASKNAYTEQWKAAHDIASVRALNRAFEDCREGNSYDLEAIWHLVGICRWLIGILERLMKQCIYVGDPDTSPPISVTGSPGKSLPDHDLWRAPENAILLFLFHPFALQSLQEAVGHIKRFRDELVALSPTQENSQIAKDVFMDTVDSSGININTLSAKLDEHKAAIKLPPDVFRKSFVACRPAPASWSFLRESAARILNAGVIDRPKLFIKPSELADGVARVSLTEQVKERESDVITKGILLHRGMQIVCVRCGGRSEVGGDGGPISHVSARWKTWEMLWASRCVCGGAWMRVPL